MISAGVGLFPTEPVGALRDYTALAESLGYEHVWFGDSQNIWRESSVTMGAAAVGTERVILGSGVTNAVTRHLSLLASTWATLAEQTGGRVALGIGTGDSSLRTMGLKPLKLRELEHAIDQLRTLFRGEEAIEPTSGARFRLSYLTEPVRIPIYVAASAPRILELAGRVADGVIALVGTSPEFIDAALRRIEAGARASGRTLADLHVVLWTPTAIADDPVQARDLTRAHVARVCIRPLPAEIDPSLQEAVDRIRETYDYYHHMDTTAAHAGLVPDELVDLFALAGTPQECRERTAKVAASGVDQIAIVPFVRPGESRADTMRAFADIAAAP
ncbi:MAG: LLM class flavin-dependent oxidoreductase [Streptosporangiales bacterium]|nr:LLM class flavin-dependent oxidoreductase [Streptosporangiales bacterium]